MTSVYVGERLHRLEVHAAADVGAQDLAGRWAVVAYRSDRRGYFVRTSYREDKPAAVALAQQLREADAPGCDIGVYCERCHTREAHLFGYVCCACPAPTTARRTA